MINIGPSKFQIGKQIKTVGNLDVLQDEMCYNPTAGKKEVQIFSLCYLGTQIYQ